MKKLLLFVTALFMTGILMAQINVTFNIDVTGAEGFDPATHDVYLAGDFAGWTTPGEDSTYLFTTADDIIYTLILPVDSSRIQFKYFFVEPGSPTWDNGEWTGTDNRHHLIVEEITFDHVWGDRPVVFTFNVDMSTADPFDPATNDVYMAGDLISGWMEPGTASDYKLEPVAGKEMMYTLSLPLYIGEHLYKYFLVIDNEPSWNNGEWEGDPNRMVAVDTIITEVSNVWGVIDGINNFSAKVTFTMFPNPVENVLHLTDLNGATKVEIYNVVGKLVHSVELFSNEVSINTQEYNSGVYFVTVHSNSGVQSTKFLKK